MMFPVLTEHFMKGFFVGVVPGVFVLLWGWARFRAKLAEAKTDEAVRLEKIAVAEARVVHVEAELAAAVTEAVGLRQVVGDERNARARLEERLVAEQRLAREKLETMAAARAELVNSFKAVSGDVLRHNAKSFLDLAQGVMAEVQGKATRELDLRRQSIDELVKPLRESLLQVDQQLRQVEKERAATNATLAEQMKVMTDGQAMLRDETAGLSKALKAPTVRGRWGEIQLKRVVELAGMAEYCDFEQQATTESEQGQLRPDMIIRLPGDRNIVVDSKAVLLSYLEAVEADNEETRRLKMIEHGRRVRTHVTKLASKAYWSQFAPSPEFVVMFLPGENFFSAALEHDPGLIEYGVAQKVILATPTTLIALLRSVSYGWRHQRLAENAQAIAELGRTLHERLKVMAGHFIDMGKGLDRAVDAYNRGAGSFESRVLVTARRFSELEVVSGGELPSTHLLGRARRSLAEELCPEQCESLGEGAD